MFHYLQQALRRRGPNEFIPLDIQPDNGFNYLKLVSRCRTQNEFNRLHIVFENILTPRELAGIGNLAKTSRFSKPSLSWLEKIRTWAPQLFDAPQEYERRSFSRYVTLYEDPKLDARDKSLLVIFSGNGRRPMMPVSVFLQFVNSRSWDVVVLKKCARNSYLLGLEGISADLPGLIECLRSTIASGRYQRVITLGTSAGGFAAIWAAVLLSADRGVSVGGSPPRPLPQSLRGDQGTASRADLCFVYGAGATADYQAALLLLGIFGGRLRSVPEVDKHSVLGHLLKRSQFAQFLDEMLV